MRYWYDTEFIESGPEHPIDLISIGIVCEDGRELYMQSAEFDAEKANEWVKENVLPHLLASCLLTSRVAIRDAILAFMDVEKYGKPELWGWCSGYDWVALCQLFGTMMDIPAGWPHYVRDIQQVLDAYRITDDLLPQPDGQAHNALTDARQIQKIWVMLYEQR